MQGHRERFIEGTIGLITERGCEEYFALWFGKHHAFWRVAQSEFMQRGFARCCGSGRRCCHRSYCFDAGKNVRCLHLDDGFAESLFDSFEIGVSMCGGKEARVALLNVNALGTHGVVEE